MRIIHKASCTRSAGFMGGVEYFGWLLSQALGCECWSDGQYHGEKLSDTLFIVDGAHGLDVPESIPVVAVTHGTWVGFWSRANWQPEVDPSIAPYEPSQIRMFGLPNVPGRKNTFIVAVSSGAKRELEVYHGQKQVPVLLHGVDHDVFTPRPRGVKGARPIILYTSQNSPYKGSHIIEKLKVAMPQFHFQPLNMTIDREYLGFQDADMAIHFSCSEGNSFFCLQAMSCDLPMVVSNVGLFESDVDSSIVGRVIPYVSRIDDIQNAIWEVWEEREKFHPRQWIEEHATFNHFKARWHDLIANVDKLNLTFN